MNYLNYIILNNSTICQPIFERFCFREGNTEGCVSVFFEHWTSLLTCPNKSDSKPSVIHDSDVKT